MERGLRTKGNSYRQPSSAVALRGGRQGYGQREAGGLGEEKSGRDLV